MVVRRNKPWFIVIQDHHRFRQIRLTAASAKFVVLFASCAAVAIIILSMIVVYQQKRFQLVSQDLYEAGNLIQKIKQVSNKQAGSGAPAELLTALDNLPELTHEAALPPTEFSSSRAVILNELSDLQAQHNALIEEKGRLSLILSMMTSEISGNQKLNEELKHERELLIKRINSLTDNLAFENERSVSLAASLQRVIESLSGVVGLPSLTNGDAVISANQMAKRLRALFATQSELVSRLTSETNKASIAARKIIEKAGFIPEDVINFPEQLNDSQSSIYQELGFDTTSVLTTINQTLQQEQALPDLTSFALLDDKQADPVDFLDRIVFDDASGGGSGGPLLPPLPEAEPETLNNGNLFARNLASLNGAIDTFDATQKFLQCLPLDRPLNTGRLSSGFGNRRDPINGKYAFHSGTDFAARRNTEIFATGDGKVTLARWAGQYGRSVIVDHGCGIKTLYAHMTRIGVKQGEKVTAGQLIGYMGATGRATGTHLHYEVIYQGRHLNPLKIIRVKNDLW